MDSQTDVPTAAGMEELVRFDKVKSSYSLSTTSHLTLTYTLGAGSSTRTNPQDWIGLFQSPWQRSTTTTTTTTTRQQQQQQHPLAFTWSALKGKTKRKKKKTKGEDTRQVIFSLEDVSIPPKAEDEEKEQLYQFVYVSKDGSVFGKSRLFSIKGEELWKLDDDVGEFSQLSPLPSARTSLTQDSDISILSPSQIEATACVPESPVLLSYPSDIDQEVNGVDDNGVNNGIEDNDDDDDDDNDGDGAKDSDYDTDEGWEITNGTSEGGQGRKKDAASSSEFSDIEILSKSPSKEDSMVRGQSINAMSVSESPDHSPPDPYRDNCFLAAGSSPPSPQVTFCADFSLLSATVDSLVDENANLILPSESEKKGKGRKRSKKGKESVTSKGDVMSEVCRDLGLDGMVVTCPGYEKQTSVTESFLEWFRFLDVDDDDDDDDNDADDIVNNRIIDRPCLVEEIEIGYDNQLKKGKKMKKKKKKTQTTPLIVEISSTDSEGAGSSEGTNEGKVGLRNGDIILDSKSKVKVQSSPIEKSRVSKAGVSMIEELSHSGVSKERENSPDWIKTANGGNGTTEGDVESVGTDVTTLEKDDGSGVWVPTGKKMKRTKNKKKIKAHESVDGPCLFSDFNTQANISIHSTHSLKEKQKRRKTPEVDVKVISKVPFNDPKSRVSNHESSVTDGAREVCIESSHKQEKITLESKGKPTKQKGKKDSSGLLPKAKSSKVTNYEFVHETCREQNGDIKSEINETSLEAKLSGNGENNEQLKQRPSNALDTPTSETPKAASPDVVKVNTDQGKNSVRNKKAKNKKQHEVVMKATEKCSDEQKSSNPNHKMAEAEEMQSGLCFETFIEKQDDITRHEATSSSGPEGCLSNVIEKKTEGNKSANKNSKKCSILKQELDTKSNKKSKENKTSVDSGNVYKQGFEEQRIISDQIDNLEGGSFSNLGETKQERKRRRKEIGNESLVVTDDTSRGLDEMISVSSQDNTKYLAKEEGEERLSDGRPKASKPKGKKSRPEKTNMADRERDVSALQTVDGRWSGEGSDFQTSAQDSEEDHDKAAGKLERPNKEQGSVLSCEGLQCLRKKYVSKAKDRLRAKVKASLKINARKERLGKVKAGKVIQRLDVLVHDGPDKSCPSDNKIQFDDTDELNCARQHQQSCSSQDVQKYDHDASTSPHRYDDLSVTLESVDKPIKSRERRCTNIEKMRSSSPTSTSNPVVVPSNGINGARKSRDTNLQAPASILTKIGSCPATESSSTSFSSTTTAAATSQGRGPHIPAYLLDIMDDLPENPDKPNVRHWRKAMAKRKGRQLMMHLAGAENKGHTAVMAGAAKKKDAVVSMDKMLGPDSFRLGVRVSNGIRTVISTTDDHDDLCPTAPNSLRPSLTYAGVLKGVDVPGKMNKTSDVKPSQQEKTSAKENSLEETLFVFTSSVPRTVSPKTSLARARRSIFSENVSDLTGAALETQCYLLDKADDARHKFQRVKGQTGLVHESLRVRRKVSRQRLIAKRRQEKASRDGENCMTSVFVPKCSLGDKKSSGGKSVSSCAEDEQDNHVLTWPRPVAMWGRSSQNSLSWETVEEDGKTAGSDESARPTGGHGSLEEGQGTGTDVKGWMELVESYHRKQGTESTRHGEAAQVSEAATVSQNRWTSSTDWGLPQTLPMAHVVIRWLQMEVASLERQVVFLENSVNGLRDDVKEQQRKKNRTQFKVITYKKKYNSIKASHMCQEGSDLEPNPSHHSELRREGSDVITKPLYGVCCEEEEEPVCKKRRLENVRPAEVKDEEKEVAFPSSRRDARKEKRASVGCNVLYPNVQKELEDVKREVEKHSPSPHPDRCNEPPALVVNGPISSNEIVSDGVRCSSKTSCCGNKVCQGQYPLQPRPSPSAPKGRVFVFQAPEAVFPRRGQHQSTRPDGCGVAHDKLLGTASGSFSGNNKPQYNNTLHQQLLTPPSPTLPDLSQPPITPPQLVRMQALPRHPRGCSPGFRVWYQLPADNVTSHSQHRSSDSPNPSPTRTPLLPTPASGRFSPRERQQNIPVKPRDEEFERLARSPSPIVRNVKPLGPKAPPSWERAPSVNCCNNSEQSAQVATTCNCLDDPRGYHSLKAPLIKRPPVRCSPYDKCGARVVTCQKRCLSSDNGIRVQQDHCNNGCCCLSFSRQDFPARGPRPCLPLYYHCDHRPMDEYEDDNALYQCYRPTYCQKSYFKKQPFAWAYSEP